jgi:hypothetical protein
MFLDVATSKQLDNVVKSIDSKFKFLAKRLDRLNQRILDMENILENYVKPIKILEGCVN